MNAYKVRVDQLPLKQDAKEGEPCRENVAKLLQIKAFRLGYKLECGISVIDTHPADSLALFFQSSGSISSWEKRMDYYADWINCKEISWQEFLALPEPGEETEEKPYHEYPEGSLFETLESNMNAAIHYIFKPGSILELQDYGRNDEVSVRLSDGVGWAYFYCDSIRPIRPYKGDRPEAPKPKTINRNGEMIGRDYRESSKMELEYSAKVYEQSKQAVIEQKEYPATALVEYDFPVKL